VVVVVAKNIPLFGKLTGLKLLAVLVRRAKKDIAIIIWYKAETK
jgi:hypothetical protein